MTLQTFPAASGTQVVFADDRPPFPVVGWALVQGSIVYPLTPMRFGGLTHGCALEDPSGNVHDPIHGKSFESVHEWEVFMETAEPPKGNPTLRVPEHGGVAESPPTARSAPASADDTVIQDDDALVAEARRNLSEVTGQEPRPNPREPGAAGPASGEPIIPPAGVQFGTKAYETTSFWKWEASQAIFKIEGGTNYPKDARVEKIKRTDWQALKKEGWSEIDPTTGVVDGEPAPEPEDDFGGLV